MAITATKIANDFTASPHPKQSIKVTNPNGVQGTASAIQLPLTSREVESSNGTYYRSDRSFRFNQRDLLFAPVIGATVLDPQTRTHVALEVIELGWGAQYKLITRRVALESVGGKLTTVTLKKRTTGVNSHGAIRLTGYTTIASGIQAKIQPVDTNRIAAEGMVRGTGQEVCWTASNLQPDTLEDPGDYVLFDDATSIAYNVVSFENREELSQLFSMTLRKLPSAS